MSMADSKWLNLALFILSNVEKCASFGRTKPLVAVACDVRSPEFIEMEMHAAATERAMESARGEAPQQAAPVPMGAAEVAAA